MLHSSLLLLALLAGADTEVSADFVIRGATLHDGSGKPGVVGDLAIKGERIVAVGTFKVAGSPRIIEGKGLIVAPGFIDLHTHSDTPLTQPSTRANYNYLTQGVTTVVTGNCGTGPVDVARYFKTLETNKIGSNVIHQVPHNSVRDRVMGNANRVPTADELKKMEELVEQGMKDGAWSLSTGLIYNPGTYAKTDELIVLAKVASRHGGFYASHIRDEGTGLLIALEEAVRIGREANLPVHISHLKAFEKSTWGKSADAIALINEARAKGQVVTADQYPYTASSTSLIATLVPAQFRDGTAKEFIARLDDAEQGPKLRAAVEKLLDGRAGSIRIAYFAKKPAWQGKDIRAIAAEEKKNPIDVALEMLRGGGAQVVNFSMSEEDVRLIMKQPFVATASDGSAMVPSSSVPHPRAYGTFPRKIGRYALVDGVISPEQAIRSASGLPADILKLPERGYLKAGYFADVVVLEPEKFRDLATYDKPHQYSTGVKYLFVNGQLAIDNDKSTGTLAGRVLRHQSK